MQYKVILTQSDIENIVAKKFNVPSNKVTLFLKDEYVGFRTDEHIEKVPMIEVRSDTPIIGLKEERLNDS